MGFIDLLSALHQPLAILLSIIINQSIPDFGWRVLKIFIIASIFCHAVYVSMGMRSGGIVCGNICPDLLSSQALIHNNFIATFVANFRQAKQTWATSRVFSEWKFQSSMYSSKYRQVRAWRVFTNPVRYELYEIAIYLIQCTSDFVR